MLESERRLWSGIKMRPLLSDYAKRHRLKAVLPFICGDVLDLGCGWLHLPDHLAEGQHYVGVDAWSAAVRYNEQLYPTRTFHQCDLDTEPLALGDYRFDIVTMVAVLEHLRHPERILYQIPSLLQPGGLLLITTPSPFGDMVHRLGSRLHLFYSEAHVQHVKIYSRRALNDLIVGCGYHVQHFRTFLVQTNQLLVCRPIHQNTETVRHEG